MKRLALVKRIEQMGCVLLRHGSRHDIYHNPITGHSEPVPRHREINDHADANPAQKDGILKALNYFIKNWDRMRYATFSNAVYFVGSGVIEAGCKTVVGKRAKQSGTTLGMGETLCYIFNRVIYSNNLRLRS